MILVTHGTGGAVTAALFTQNPAAGFFFGFLSHFILDTIPHWHYPIHAISKNEANKIDREIHKDSRLFFDFIRTGIDAGLGIYFAYLFSVINPEISLSLVFWGAVGGILPDFLQLLHYLNPRGLLRPLQEFHIKIHAKTNLDDQPLVGIGSQSLLILACFGLIFIFS